MYTAEITQKGYNYKARRKKIYLHRGLYSNRKSEIFKRQNRICTTEKCIMKQKKVKKGSQKEGTKTENKILLQAILKAIKY